MVFFCLFRLPWGRPLWSPCCRGPGGENGGPKGVAPTARRVECADGALTPRQRDAFVPIELSKPRADVRQDVVVKWDYAPSTVVPWGHGLGRARASARSIAHHKRSENEGGRRNPVKSGASVRSSRVGFASIAPFRARRDRGRLPPTTGPVCQGWAIPSRARNGHQ